MVIKIITYAINRAHNWPKLSEPILPKTKNIYKFGHILPLFWDLFI